jgi:hypothetical protein
LGTFGQLSIMSKTLSPSRSAAFNMTSFRLRRCPAQALRGFEASPTTATKGEWGVQGILGVRALMRGHGIVAVEDACGATLELGFPNYRFVRRYLVRRPRPPLVLRQVDPLIASCPCTATTSTA